MTADGGVDSLPLREPAGLPDALPMPALVTDAGREWGNGPLYSFLGLDPSQPLRWLAHIRQADAEQVEAIYRRSLKGGGAFSLAIRLRRHDGYDTPLRVECSPMPGGAWLHMFFEIAHQVPLSRKAAKGPQVCAREGMWDCNNLHALFVATPDLMFVVDPQGRILRWNEMVERRFCLSQESLLQRPLVDFVPEAVRAEAAASLARLLSGEAELCELVFDAPGGPLNMEIRCGRPREDHVGGFFVICHDITLHLQRETALKLSEHRYRGIVDGIADGLAVVDDEFRAILHNPRLAQMFGVGDAGLVGRCLLDFVSSADRGRLQRRVLDFAVDESTLDVRIQREDGRPAWAQFSCFSDSTRLDGGPCTMLVFSDITARKEAEEQVRHQHQFVNQVLDTLPMGVMVQQAGPRGPVTLWNRRMEQLFGISSRQAAGRSLADLVDPMMAGGLLDAIDTVAEAASPRTFEDVSIACSSGEAFIAQITVAPVFGGHGAQRSLLVILNDVTERFRAEAEQRRLSEALARREESYRTLADNATDLITRHDASGVITFASHVARKMLGVAAEELVGQHPSRFIDPQDRRLYERFITRLRELEGPAILTYRMLRADGSALWVETSGEVRRVPGSVEFTCVTRDVGERKRAEDELLQVQRQLSDAVESMDSALAMYDAEDRLVLCNSRYRELLPNAAGLIRPGVPYEEVIASVLSGPLPEDAEMTIEEWKAMRMREHRNPSGRGRFQRLAGDRWVQITDFPTSEGGVVSLLTDVTQLKRIQEELNRQTLMLTSLLDSIPDIIFYKDAQGVYVGCNPAFCEFVGRPRESVLGKTDFDLFPDDLARFFLANDRLMLETGTERRNEEWVAYPDGRLVLLDTLKTPMKSGGGLVGISRDITERHQAESLLRAESSRLSTLIQSMEGGVLVEDERRCIHLVNRVFMRLFDIPGNPEDIIGADCRLALKMVAPMFARPDTVMATLEGLTRGNEPARSIIIEMKGQRFLECDFSPIAIGGNAYNYLWHYRDITSRRRAELELQQRDVMLRGLAETTRQLLAGLDDFDNSIIEAFRIIAETAQVDGVRILQLDSQRAGAGRTISQRYMWSRYRGTVRPSEELQNLSVDPDHTRWLNELGRGGMLAGNLSSFPENERRALEGRGVGSLLITPLFLEGVLWGALEFSTRELRDWTPVDRNILRMAADSVGYALQRKRSRDELNQALSEAERLAIEADKASKATTDFLASMSHEIRTPLNGLVGYANLLRSTGLSERQTYLLGGLDRSSEILLALINDILDLSKISAGQISLDSSPMMPAGIVQDVMEALRPRVEEKRLKLVFEPLGLPAHGFLGDERRLKQVLLNLLGNAIKFTASGGITITVSATSPDAAGGDWRLDFAVKDSGIGIARDNLSRLFLPFSQAANDISRRFGGTGLGLSICRQLVTLMGGQIGVESVVGEGSTFRFHIMCPAAEAPEQPAQGHACGGTARVGDDMPLRILVADDNVINQEVLSLYLEEMGYAPAIVDDGAAAFEAVKKGDIDLVFMDLRMPVMDGRESARAIRRWEAENLPAGRSPVVIIALTADALKSDFLECTELGMDDYVTKPIEPEKIELLIRKHFEEVKK